MLRIRILDFDVLSANLKSSNALALILSPGLLRELDRLAKREGRARNELLREAVRRYVNESKWRELQEYGRNQARKLGIKESDVERLIHEYRSGH